MLVEQRCVVPGEMIGSLPDFKAGSGTHVRGGEIFASITGYVHASSDVSPPVVSVLHATHKPTVVPKQGDVVICKVIKVNPRQASVKIVCVGENPLVSDFPGIIRSLEVRQTQVDEVEIYNCFRPGDIVRAEVISLGDKRSYYLSTAKNEYGVIFAKSVAGATMVPISWDLMQCPKTKMTEHRKVAKI